jgi:DNA polymerase IV
MHPPTHLRWLFLDLNSYFASVEQHLQPHLRGKPIAVVPLDSEATCAIAASYEAKAFGIKTGTRIYEARQMCRDLITVPARHDVYVEYHHRIIEAVERCIPVTRVCSIDEVACRLLTNEQAPETALALAHRVKAEIRDSVGGALTSSIGLAPNVLLAKMGSDMQKPDGLTVIPPDGIFERLRTCDLQDVPGIGANMYKRLLRANVPDMHTLWHLQPKQARAVLGSIMGERLWWELHGYDMEPPPTQKRTVGHSHVLDPSLRNLRDARHVARRLLSKAASRLRRMDYEATRLALSIRMDHGPRCGLEMPMPATSDSLALLRHFEGLWAKVTDGMPVFAQAKKVSVTLFGLQPMGRQQLDLFQKTLLTPSPRAPHHAKLAHAMDGLNKRFGRDTVNFGVWKNRAVNRYTGTKIAFSRIPERAEFHE